MNRFDMGGGDLKDVLFAAKFLETTRYVDSKKIVIMGGSYGGYMTLMGVTQAPDVWAAGVAIVPFVNWFTEVKHEDPLLQQYDLATMGDPEKKRCGKTARLLTLFKVSVPRSYSSQATTTGAARSEESDQVAEALRAKRGVVEYQVYENKGHGLSRLENQIDSYKRVAAFLNKYVK